MMALLASGCAVVNGEHAESLRRTDGGTDLEDGEVRRDGGGPRFDDTCGAPEPQMLLARTTRSIEIDTREGYRSAVAMSCGVSTPGNDVFIAVDVLAGQYWHFHLTTPDTNRQPMLFLTPASSCDTRNCEYVSAACSGGGEEHFGFVANSSGRWFIGIDDGAPGGGEYVLEAYRPTCGDGTAEHGEACDDGNRLDGDGCDRNCRRELSEAQTVEIEANDNRSEANVLRLPASNELTITGNIGGPGACTYADVFAVSVPMGAGLQVDALQPDGVTVCAHGSLTPYRMSLENPSGASVSSNMQDANGCAIVRATNLMAGEYFIRVAIPAETPIAAEYRLQVRLVP